MRIVTNVLGGLVALSILCSCDGGGMGCSDDFDCFDAFDCTTDVCGMGNVCRNTPVDAVCDTGQVCDPGRGCIDSGSGECASNEECDDGQMCTNDVCGVGGECMNMPLNERCASGEICDPMMGCVPDTGCDSAADCDDGVACTNDTCGADRTCNNLPVNEMCDTSMMEICVPGVGCQVVEDCMEDSDCRLPNFCDGVRVCNTEFGCETTGPTVCNDGDDCTIDMCDASAPGEMGQTGACRFDCDSSRPECMCPAPGPTCNGRFSLPGAQGVCSLLGGAATWTWNFSNVNFVRSPTGAIEVQGWTVTSSASVPPMADPGPTCPNVDAMTGLSGDCNEEYRIQGTFLDDNTFMGMFSATFTGSLGFPPLLPPEDCSPCSMNIMVNGTRM